MLFIVIFLVFSGIGMASTVDDQTRKLVHTVLVKELKIAENEISILSSKTMNWANSSLGCPVKGQYYLPVGTPGHLVKVKAKGKTYTVHTGMNSAIVCDPKRTLDNNRSSGVPLRKESRQVKSIQLSRELLLVSTQSESKNVSLVSIKKIPWSSIQETCSEQNTFEKSSNGFLVVLKLEDEVSRFFSDGIKVVHCSN